MSVGRVSIGKRYGCEVYHRGAPCRHLAKVKAIEGMPALNLDRREPPKGVKSVLRPV
jgi:hypothetical protein